MESSKYYDLADRIASAKFLLDDIQIDLFNMDGNYVEFLECRYLRESAEELQQKCLETHNELRDMMTGNKIGQKTAEAEVA